MAGTVVGTWDMSVNKAKILALWISYYGKNRQVTNDARTRKVKLSGIWKVIKNVIGKQTPKVHREQGIGAWSPFKGSLRR